MTSLVFEREFAHPPAKVWRALTVGDLIADWLMANDFEPTVGHRFRFRADPAPNWDGIVDCEVLTVEPERQLAYRWGAGDGLKTVVTLTLTPTQTGTHLRMEQSGFGAEDDPAYRGASYGWTRFLAKLERTVAEHG